TTCQSSYPLKSENATPLGVFSEYLSCAEMATPPKPASTATTTPIVNVVLRFIASLSYIKSHALHCYGRTDLSLRVLRENVISPLDYGVAGEPAFGTVLLRRVVGGVAGPERFRLGVILELGISPSATVREPLAVLHHEVDVMLGARYLWLAGVRLL